MSGIEVNALNLMDGIRDRGHAVYCLMSGWSDRDFQMRLSQMEIPHDTVWFGKLTKSLDAHHIRGMAKQIVHYPSALWHTHRSLSSFGPDVVLLFNRDTALLGAPLFHRWPCLFHVDELPPASAWHRRLYSSIDRWLCGWIAVSNAIGEELRQLGIESDRIHTVYNGVHIPSSITDGLGTAPVTLGICGQIGPWKGHEVLLDALALLHQQSIPFRCLIFGRGSADYVAALKAQCKASGIAERVEWRGFEANLDMMYDQLDIVVAPSLISEAFGLTAAEAGARGLPVVVSRLGGLTEVVADRKTGFVVEPGAAEPLAHALAMLLADADLRRQIGAAGRQRIHAHFSVERMIARHEVVFEEIVAQKRQGC